MVASSVLLASLARQIGDLGFRPQGHEIFTFAIDDYVSGWLGLNIARRGLGADTVTVHPIVGVRHASVEALVARIQDKPLDLQTPTISRPLRELGGARPVVSWMVSPNLPDGGTSRPSPNGTVSTGSTTQTSVYDASGQLLLQTDGSTGSTLYLGDTELHLAAGSSTASAVRTYASGGTAIAERTSTAGVSGTVLQWLGTDPQNTASNEVAVSTGAVASRYADPFGNSRGSAVAWSSAHSFLNAPVSTLSGLVQLGARAYDSTIGKFLSVDSVLAPFNPIQNNGYSYAGNSPVTASDPSGDCYTMPNGSGCIGYTHVTGASSKAPAAPKGPDIGAIVNKAWKKQLNIAGQFYSGMGESLYSLGKFFLWDANIGGATANLVNQIGCVSNYATCEAQREAVAAPWQADFWGTAEKTIVDPVWNDFRDHPAHAIGALIPDLATFAIPGGGLIKGARAAEELSAATDLEAQAASRAAQLQAELSAGSGGRVTMGVGIGQDSSGTLHTVVGTSEPGGYLRAGVRVSIGSSEEVATGSGHAEQSILAYMRGNGITPLTIGAGRPICPMCAVEISDSGASAATGLKQ